MKKLHINKIFVFGNQDLAYDDMPLRMLDELRTRWKQIEFVSVDPNEEWSTPENLFVIDTVDGLDRVTLIDGINIFQNSPRITGHNFDALAYMKYLVKLGKIKDITIVGIPPNISYNEAVAQTIDAINILIQ